VRGVLRSDKSRNTSPEFQNATLSIRSFFLHLGIGTADAKKTGAGFVSAQSGSRRAKTRRIHHLGKLEGRQQSDFAVD